MVAGLDVYSTDRAPKLDAGGQDLDDRDRAPSDVCKLQVWDLCAC